jgi:hypothetical protein
LDAGANQRDDDETAAEEVAVTDDDLMTETLEGVGEAVAVALTGEEEVPVPPAHRPPVAPPEPGARCGGEQPSVPVEVEGVRVPPHGPEEPGPPAAKPEQPPPPDPGEPEGTDMPFGVGEDSPMNEGSEDTAVPPVDPAEQRLRGPHGSPQ